MLLPRPGAITKWEEYAGFFFFSSRRRHTRCSRDWSSDVCSSDLLRRQRRHFPAHAPSRDPHSTLSQYHPVSQRINHIGGCFDDLPEGTVGTVVVNAPRIVRAQFL